MGREGKVRSRDGSESVKEIKGKGMTNERVRGNEAKVSGWENERD